MIPFFVGYALLVWIPAAMHRRRGLGFLIVLTGALGLVGISLAHFQLRHMNPSWFIEGMQVMLYPYSVVVTVVGLYIALLPRTFEGCCPSCAYSLVGLPVSRRLCPECGEDLRPDRCPSCRYDLMAVPSSNPRCPGCGFDFHKRRHIRRHRQSGAERSDLRSSDLPSASHEAPRQPEHQDHPGQPRDERPGERAPSPG